MSIRIGFYIPEVEFMNRNDPRNGGTLSYQQIATALNEKWPQYNGGKRTRGTVIDYYYRKRQVSMTSVRMVSLPKKISDTLSCTDIQRIIISHAERIGTKQV